MDRITHAKDNKIATSGASMVDQPFFAAGYLSSESLEVIVNRSIAGPGFPSPREQQQTSTSFAIAPQYALLLAVVALLSPSPISLRLRRLSSNFQTSIFPSTRRAISSVSSVVKYLAGYSGLAWTLVPAHTYVPIRAIFENKRIYCRHQKRFYSPKHLVKRLVILTTGMLLVCLSQIIGLRMALAISALSSMYLQALLTHEPRNALRQDYSDVNAGLVFMMVAASMTTAISLPRMIILAGGLAVAFQFEIHMRKMHWKEYLQLYCSLMRTVDTGMALTQF